MVARCLGAGLMASTLFTGSTLAAEAAGGNRVLLEQARQKAFLLNEAVVRQLGLLVEPAQISLTGKVKQHPDGRLEVVIDRLDVQGPAESGSFPFDQAPGKPPIDYVIFEEIPEDGN